MQIPDIYTLEHLSDEEFWDIAFTKAFSTPSTRIPFAHLPPGSYAMSEGQQEAATQLSLEPSLVCDGRYAFPLHALYEIISMPQHITFLPDTPAWMMGLIAWRGRVLATINLHAYLHRTTSNLNVNQHIKQDVHTNQDVITNQGINADQGVIELRPYTLLIAHHADTILAFATTLSTISTFEQIDTFIHLNSSDSTSTSTSSHPSSVLLDMPTIFEDIVQHLEKTSSHE